MNNVCYSKLHSILIKKEITVIDLYRKLKKQNIQVNIKSLYRLNNPIVPIEKIDTRVAGQICDSLKIDLSSLFTFREKIDSSKFSSLSQDTERKLNILLEKNREGNINTKEKKELAKLIEETEQIMLSNVLALSEQKRTLDKKAPRRKSLVLSGSR